ncbi:methyltransferase family protein [Variovorax sp.]|uniref:methyltransferase family protein n=1 Tax=Variovorax sp. TaxID=1871043 RepID=UPI002D6E7578|nr:methyltransferase [Variovorax sp.]HYP85102.1 methyltransferase [Variovorax sp.]
MTQSLPARLALFAVATLFFLWVSRHALRNPRAHGFFRFFAWECIAALVVLNAPRWEAEPFSPRQLVSWLLLFLSPWLAWLGVHALKARGQPDARRADAELLAFERTTRLVTQGVFRHIRHPMYAALLALAWGAYLKDVSPASTALVALCSLMLLLTAQRDEAECLAHFGPDYAQYMQRSKRFIPGVF